MASQVNAMDGHLEHRQSINDTEMHRLWCWLILAIDHFAITATLCFVPDSEIVRVHQWSSQVKHVLISTTKLNSYHT